MDGQSDHIIRAELARIGLRWANCVSWNADATVLYQHVIDRGEAQVANGGALVVSTGPHTGRSPKDKFVVRDDVTEASVWWDNNQSMSRKAFDTLRSDMMAHARMKSLFVQDLIAGADATYQLPTRIITEFAWHALFIRHLLRVPSTPQDFVPALTIINLPSFKADPDRHGTRSETVIALDLKNRIVLIGGTQYAGEIKKAVFTVMNFILPTQGVLPMHCSANVGEKGDTAIFFGLSGTGKTTLSTDPQRALIGDDEHGWSPNGVFNIEGGCYAKVVNLSAENEPDIHTASLAHGTVLENVMVDPVTRQPDFSDTLLTENTRAAYPLSAIKNADPTGIAAAPKAIIMLTADAFGVLPPIAKLTADQAMDHFLAGYTAKVAGTERGITEPQATFSACFGAPFLPRHPSVYGTLLRDLIALHNVPVYLVNTGWTGGAFGTGHRMPIKITRALVAAALSGELASARCRVDENFGFEVPVAVAGVESTLLDPRKTWTDATSYDAAAKRLVGLFAENASKFDAVPMRMVAAQ